MLQRAGRRLYTQAAAEIDARQDTMESEELRMPYRQLSREEIIQLGRDLEDQARWEGARDYVSALYGLEPRGQASAGPHQITIVVVTTQTHLRDFEEMVEIVVTDTENHALPYDLSRYWWMQFSLTDEERTAIEANASGKLAAIREINRTVYDGLCDLCHEFLGITPRGRIPMRQAPITFTYLLDSPPTLRIPALYVDE
jgi:hypothetical protein